MSQNKTFFATPFDTEQAFYEALERGDVDTLMSLWADDDDIVCVHPAGQRLVGHQAIRAAWIEALSQGSIHVRTLNVRTTQAMMVAVHNLLEQVTVVSERQTHRFNLYTTHVFFKTPDGWRMVLHHSSAAEDGAGGHEGRLAPSPGILH